MIAGLKISYLPGTHVESGGYMLGKIAPEGPWCGSAPTAPLVSAGTGDIETSPVLTKPNLKVYPNPTTGSFKLEITGAKYEQIRVEIYGMTGETVLSETRSGATVYDFSLSGRPAGIYFIKVVSGETIMSTKLVKTR